jgi:hypothetical protein
VAWRDESRGGGRTFLGIVALNSSTWRSGLTWPNSERTCGLGEGETAVHGAPTGHGAPTRRMQSCMFQAVLCGLLYVDCADYVDCSAWTAWTARAAPCGLRGLRGLSPSLTWGSNPMSNMRSASSSTTYVTRARVQAFILIKSVMRPGVAMAA